VAPCDRSRAAGIAAPRVRYPGLHGRSGRAGRVRRHSRCGPGGV